MISVQLRIFNFPLDQVFLVVSSLEMSVLLFSTSDILSNLILLNCRGPQTVSVQLRIFYYYADKVFLVVSSLEMSFLLFSI